VSGSYSFTKAIIRLDIGNAVGVQLLGTIADSNRDWTANANVSYLIDQQPDQARPTLARQGECPGVKLSYRVLEFKVHELRNRERTLKLVADSLRQLNIQVRTRYPAWSTSQVLLDVIT
jgi:hypothetical protein